MMAEAAEHGSAAAVSAVLRIPTQSRLRPRFGNTGGPHLLRRGRRQVMQRQVLLQQLEGAPVSVPFDEDYLLAGANECPRQLASATLNPGVNGATGRMRYAVGDAFSPRDSRRRYHGDL